MGIDKGKRTFEIGDSMKIGIIGAGYAAQVHSRVIKDLYPDIKQYVYDVKLHAAQEFAKNQGCQAVKTLEELYDEIEAVIIATPTFTHYKIAMEAMQKGKHILCEKPMAVRGIEAEEMFMMGKEKGLICAIGFNYRYFEITKIMKELDQIGEINQICFLIKRLCRNDWHNKDNGVLADLGIHLIDLVAYLCGQEIELSSSVVRRKCMEGWDYDSNVCGKTEKGISFELTASRIKESKEVRFYAEIEGTEGVFRYDSRQETIYEIEKNNISKIYYFEKSKKTDGFFDFTDSVWRQDADWIRSLSGEKKKKMATFEDGFYAQKVLDYYLSKKRMIKGYE